MTEQQGTEFDLWFEQHMDPELTLTPGDKELCRHAWLAGRSHAEGEAPFAYCFTDVNGRPSELTGPPEHAAPEDKRVITALYKHPAPQVAVPEAVKERVVEAIAEALGDAKDCIRVWTAWGVGTMGPDDFLDVAEDPDRLDEIAEAAITAMFTAAPTAPAGEPEPAEKHPWTARLAQTEQRTPIEALTSDLGAAIEKLGAHPLLTDAQTLINEALCTLGAWHDQGEPGGTGEQPVSDPDGLTEPGRREAEQAYINCAFDYARDPIGSRDWILFWNGWRARNKAAPAPDEREIAAKALSDFASLLRCRSFEYADPVAVAQVKKDARLCEQESYRLHAGKEGETS